MSLFLDSDSNLDWGSHIVSTAKAASKKVGALTHSMKLLFPKVPLYLYKSTILPCLEYYCYIWDGAPSSYLNMLYKLQKQISQTNDPSLNTSFEPLAHP